MGLARQLGARVKSVRLARGLTQSKLAERAEMTSDEVSRIERGAREPRFLTIERLAAALGVSPSDLFAGSEHAQPASRRHGPPSFLGVDLEPDLAEALAQCARLLARALARRTRQVAPGRRRNAKGRRLPR